MRVIGIDGCKAGWVCIALEAGRAEHWVSRRFEDVMIREPAVDLILIDIPVGLLEEGTEHRAPDAAARKLLGKRRSSVFTSPARPVLYASDYPEANELSRRLTGRGLAKQSWAIIPKIREVDEALRERFVWRGRVREVHPEVCFWGFAGGRPMRYYKKTDEGFRERFELLSARFPGAEQLLAPMVLWEGNTIARDDAVDALAAALTGVDPGALRTIPDDPQVDAYGLAMEMVYAV